MPMPAALSRWIAGPALGSGVALSAALAILTLAVLAVGSRSQQLGATLLLLHVIGVMALSVFSGGSGVLSFGHVAFLALGAQIGATLTMPPALKASLLPDLPTLVLQTELGLAGAMLVAVPLVVGFALLVGLPIARLAGASAVIATLGLLMIVHALILGSRGITRGAESMMGMPRLVDIPLALAFAVPAVVLARLWRDAIPGLQLRATREDAAAAAAIGLRVARLRLLAWTLSAALGAVAGVLMAHQLGVFSAREFYFDLTLTLIVMMGVGSATGVTGALVGAVVVTLLIEVLRWAERGVDLGVIQTPQVFGLTSGGLAVLILVILYLRPDGLLGDRELALPWPGRRPASPPSATLLPATHPPAAHPPAANPPATHPPATRVPATRVPAAAAAPSGRDAGPAALPVAPPALEVSDLTKAYGGLRAVDGVSLQLDRGQILGLIGPNGSGKTTLLGCIAGTHRPDAGGVRLAGRDMTGAPAWAVARHGLARSFQTSRVFARLTVAENVLVARAARHRDHPRQRLLAETHALLEALELGDLSAQPAGTLAYGLQRRLEIARALALDPWVMLLDEPAAGLNEVESARLLDLLRRLVAERDLALLLVDHDMALIMALCPRLVVLNQGRVIAQGPPAQIRKDPAVREAYLGRRAAGSGAAARRGTVAPPLLSPDPSSGPVPDSATLSPA